VLPGTHNFALLYLPNASGARGMRLLCEHLRRSLCKVAEVTIVFISSSQKLFPVENSSSKSLSEISLFEGQEPDAGSNQLDAAERLMKGYLLL
jgi:hypothetical protein